MLLSGSNQGTMTLIHQQFAKADYCIEPARLGENPGMSCDTDDSAQHLGRHPVAGVTINDAFQPPATQRVLVSIATESIHEHIDVRKDHVRPCGPQGRPIGLDQCPAMCRRKPWKPASVLPFAAAA